MSVYVKTTEGVKHLHDKLAAQGLGCVLFRIALAGLACCLAGLLSCCLAGVRVWVHFVFFRVFAGIICDVRQPDVIRISPAPMYNSFTDIYRFVNLLKAELKRDATS